MDYQEFLDKKGQSAVNSGFEPVWMPDFLFNFQEFALEKALRRGRAAHLFDCGLGKTPMQLTFAENICRYTKHGSGKVLVLTPLAVSPQTVREGEKFGIDVQRSKDGKPMPRVTVTNYERLHLFDPLDYDGCICDESSILKHFTGATQKQVTRFMSKIPYRLLSTATAAPNDYTELGTSAEALGELTYSDMLTRFFRQLDDKGQKMEMRKQAQNERLAKHFAKLSFRVSQSICQWRLKHHAVTPFWQWVCSWAIACRKPSDLGFDDGAFILPPLQIRDHIISPKTPPDGYLLTLPAIGLREERDERRRTLSERCEFVANLVNHDKPAVIWCHMNAEGDALVKAIPGARQVAGATPDDIKEEIYEDFAKGKLRVLVIKPKIGAFGLNWQHCAHVVTFASHSYEQFYQSVRRCWRFGQKQNVIVDVVSTEGESGVRNNMKKKADQADAMFSALVKHMNAAQRIERVKTDTNKMEVPIWA